LRAEVIALRSENAVLRSEWLAEVTALRSENAAMRSDMAAMASALLDFTSRFPSDHSVTFYKFHMVYICYLFLN
jgi:hypothetical protein